MGDFGAFLGDALHIIGKVGIFAVIAAIDRVSRFFQFAEPPRPLTIVTSEDNAPRHPPIADCARYDQLRNFHAAA
ncbi:hypothetical protein [Sphingobium baderi]|uniref:hypothetical protein n=1 Tax=Sphingobium baderi TaxID=1332080 RepID=UPI002B406856|nr:hypothetical protein [Sphingobium baderi]WRD78943.1 hypothetical protein QQ987_20150 [Sphingobium baderi]